MARLKATARRVTKATAPRPLIELATPMHNIATTTETPLAVAVVTTTTTEQEKPLPPAKRRLPADVTPVAVVNSP